MTVLLGGVPTAPRLPPTQRLLRGGIAIVLAAAPPRRREVPGVTARSLLAWALGAVPDRRGDRARRVRTVHRHRPRRARPGGRRAGRGVGRWSACSRASGGSLGGRARCSCCATPSRRSRTATSTSRSRSSTPPRSGTRRRASTGWPPGCASGSGCATCSAARSAADVARRALEEGVTLGGEERRGRGAVRRRHRLDQLRRRPPPERGGRRAQRVLRGRRRARRRTTAGWSTSSSATRRCASSAPRSPTTTRPAPRWPPPATCANGCATRARRRHRRRLRHRRRRQRRHRRALRVHGHRRPGERGGAHHRPRQEAATAACSPRTTRSRRHAPAPTAGTTSTRRRCAGAPGRPCSPRRSERTPLLRPGVALITMDYRTLGRSGCAVSEPLPGHHDLRRRVRRGRSRTPSSTASSRPAARSSTPPTSTRPASRRRSSAAGSPTGPPTSPTGSCSPPRAASRWTTTPTASACRPGT